MLARRLMRSRGSPYIHTEKTMKIMLELGKALRFN